MATDHIPNLSLHGESYRRGGPPPGTTLAPPCILRTALAAGTEREQDRRHAGAGAVAEPTPHRVQGATLLLGPGHKQKEHWPGSLEMDSSPGPASGCMTLSETLLCPGPQCYRCSTKPRGSPR